MMDEVGGGVVVVVLVVFLISWVWKIMSKMIWRPYVMRKAFEKQGIRGPSYSFLSGSLPEIKRLKKSARETIMDTHSHDIAQRLLPHYLKWSSQYGKKFLYWFQTDARICINEPELAKEVLSNKFGFYDKVKARPSMMALMGKGLVMINGLEWVKHRRVLNPAFLIDNIKEMTNRMATCTSTMINRWQDQVTESIADCKEIEMNHEFQALTTDIISYTSFGSSFIKGKKVFEVQKELQQMAIISSSDLHIPGTQYLPTRWNLRRWKLENRMRNSLKQIIESRIYSSNYDSGYGNDLLGLMMGISETESGEKKISLKLNMEEIMDECKTFFFAGHETTSTLLTWTIFLLSLYQDWQDKLREEVLRECGREIPDADKLSKLKLVNMVLLEVLRLYSPVILILRKAAKDIKLGNLMIPKDTVISIPLTMMHRDKEYWGQDANEFNPLRFADGVARAAKHPNALIAFSIGPRACIGQNFAMLEAKLVITMILQKFSFTLSPNYKHAPADKLTVQPQFGLPIILKSLNV